MCIFVISYTCITWDVTSSADQPGMAVTFSIGCMYLCETLWVPDRVYFNIQVISIAFTARCYNNIRTILRFISLLWIKYQILDFHKWSNEILLCFFIIFLQDCQVSFQSEHWLGHKTYFTNDTQNLAVLSNPYGNTG